MSLEKTIIDIEKKGREIGFARIEEIWIQKTASADRVYIRLSCYTDEATYIAGGPPVDHRRVNVPLTPPEIPEVEEVKEGEPQPEPTPPIFDPFEDMREELTAAVDAFIAMTYQLSKKMPEWADAKDV